MITGKTIAITRSKEDSEEFIQLITNAQAKAIPLPTIELVSKGEKIVDEFLKDIKEDDRILKDIGLDATAVANIKKEISQLSI